MANCSVLDWQGKEAGKATLDLKVAKESTAVDLMHRAVLRQQAHARQGTASTLTRAEVRGGGRKPISKRVLVELDTVLFEHHCDLAEVLFLVQSQGNITLA